MNSVTRVMQAIRHRPATPVPRGELTLDRQFARNFLNLYREAGPADALADADLLFACCQVLAFDLVCIQPEADADHETGLSIKPAEIQRFLDKDLFVFWVVNGAFQRAAVYRGTMALLTAISRSPEKVCKELGEISSQVLAVMAQGVSAGAHGIIIADDIAYNQSTYMSPDFVEQYLFPIWQAQVATARDLGVPVFFHSDGNLNAVLPTIAAAGFDGLQCIDPAAGMDIKKVKARFGKTLCLMGNIDPSLLSGQVGRSHTDTRSESLRRAVTDLLESTGGHGGLIFGTSSGLHAGMSPDLVQYMYRLASGADGARSRMPS